MSFSELLPTLTLLLELSGASLCIELFAVSAGIVAFVVGMAGFVQMTANIIPAVVLAAVLGSVGLNAALLLVGIVLIFLLIGTLVWFLKSCWRAFA